MGPHTSSPPGGRDPDSSASLVPRQRPGPAAGRVPPAEARGPPRSHAVLAPHLRAPAAPGTRPHAGLHRELSSCRRSCLLWIRSSGTGKGGGRGTENKKGGGKGEEGVGDGLKLSAQWSRCCSHHLVPAATSIELRLAAGAEACLKPNLSLWGGRPTRVSPSGSFAIQSAAGLPSTTNPRRGAGRSHRESSVAAQPRRSAQSHIRECSVAKLVA